MKCFFALGLIALLAACGTTDSELRQSGYSASYIQGFHDGRHSGMQEAGNDYEDYIKDQLRFDNDADYQRGWLAGEAEGQQLQSQAHAVGEGIATGLSEPASASFDADKAAKEVLHGIDTSTLKNLE
ncbi:hypothetical protein VST7929_02980 [Vibrio stylophorae]|uniref:Lipoprotein n=1 Tax=Vibrio stylophorae TaxID=659351 RepID=A0ABM8ZXF8_9VIBR|nr:hypothetical protein [Vibrio stylophorae]CAH0535407.1 hypothetical protein VST7929_02980 [Vibrio stylophorae]